MKLHLKSIVLFRSHVLALKSLVHTQRIVTRIYQHYTARAPAKWKFHKYSTADGGLVSKTKLPNAIKKTLVGERWAFPGWTRANDRLAYIQSVESSNDVQDRGSIEPGDDFRPGGIIIRGVQRNTPCSAPCVCQKNGFALGREPRDNFLRKFLEWPTTHLSQPLVPLLSLSLSIRPSLSPLPLRSKLKEEPAGCRNVSGKISRGPISPNGKFSLAWPPLPKMDIAPLGTRVASFGSCSSTNPPSPLQRPPSSDYNRLRSGSGKGTTGRLRSTD